MNAERAQQLAGDLTRAIKRADPDSVELSSHSAVHLASLARIPAEMRADLVGRIRREIADGVYDEPNRIDKAADELLLTLFGEDQPPPPESRPAVESQSSLSDYAKLMHYLSAHPEATVVRLETELPAARDTLESAVEAMKELFKYATGDDLNVLLAVGNPAPSERGGQP